MVSLHFPARGSVSQAPKEWDASQSIKENSIMANWFTLGQPLWHVRFHSIWFSLDSWILAFPSSICSASSHHILAFFCQGPLITVVASATSWPTCACTDLLPSCLPRARKITWIKQQSFSWHARPDRIGINVHISLWSLEIFFFSIERLLRAGFTVKAILKNHMEEVTYQNSGKTI